MPAVMFFNGSVTRRFLKRWGKEGIGTNQFLEHETKGLHAQKGRLER